MKKIFFILIVISNFEFLFAIIFEDFYQEGRKYIEHDRETIYISAYYINHSCSSDIKDHSHDGCSLYIGMYTDEKQKRSVSKGLQFGVTFSSNFERYTYGDTLLVRCTVDGERKTFRDCSF